MASNLTVDTLTKGATTLNTDELVDVNNTRVAKAWVNFNGTGTVAIRDSYNVSSITDGGVGLYTVNFTTAMPDANYVISGFCSGASSGIANLGGGQSLIPLTTTSARVRTLNSSSFGDMAVVCTTAFSN